MPAAHSRDPDKLTRDCRNTLVAPPGFRSTGAVTPFDRHRRGLLVAGTLAATAPSATRARPANGRQRAIDLAGASTAILTGDFDQMHARRLIRVGVPYSRTHYYNDRGRERGITAESMRDFEQWLNRRHARQLARRPLTLVMLPTTRDTLLYPEMTACAIKVA